MSKDDQDWYARILKQGTHNLAGSIEAYSDGIQNLEEMRKRFEGKNNKEVEKSLTNAIIQWESRLEKLLELEKIWQEKK